MKRREVFKTGAALLASAVVPLTTENVFAQAPAATADDAGTLDRAWRQAIAPTQHILVKGGTIVSMDPKVGDFPVGDVLIEGKKIVGVAAAGQLKPPPNAQVIDASQTVVIPGFVDAHRHSWEGQLRRIIPDGVIGD